MMVCLFLGDPNDVDEDIVIGQKHSHPGDDEDYLDSPGPSKACWSSKNQQSARDSNNKGKTDAFEKHRPDLVLVDHSTEKLRHRQCLWQHIAVLLEVKRDAQFADMPRLHLAAHPFLRSSVHITVCDPIFNLAIFDCAGAVVSKDHNISEDLETFIRIIRRLGRDLDAYDLGLDRTIIPLVAVPRVSGHGWRVGIHHEGTTTLAVDWPRLPRDIRMDWLSLRSMANNVAKAEPGPSF